MVRIGKPRPDLYKKIIATDCNDMDTDYESVKAAAASLNIPSSDISTVLSLRQRTAGGYRFRYKI